MTKLTEHPVAALFPMMTKDELQELADDIKKNGLQEPIKLSTDGKMLIDGRNRLAACKIAKVEPRFEKLNGAEAEAYAISANIARRHMTAAQRAMVVAKIHPDGGGVGGRGKKPAGAGGFPMVPPTSLRETSANLREPPDSADRVIDSARTLARTAGQGKKRCEA